MLDPRMMVYVGPYSEPPRTHRIPDHAIPVHRRISATPERVHAALAALAVDSDAHRGPLGTAGAYELLSTPALVGADPTRWTGAARLRGSGSRLVRSTKVTLDIAAWSDRSCELTIAPAARRPGQWGARRLRRYFELAHLLADQLSDSLAFTIVEPPAPMARPVERVPVG